MFASYFRTVIYTKGISRLPQDRRLPRCNATVCRPWSPRRTRGPCPPRTPHCARNTPPCQSRSGWPRPDARRGRRRAPISTPFSSSAPPCCVASNDCCRLHKPSLQRRIWKLSTEGLGTVVEEGNGSGMSGAKRIGRAESGQKRLEPETERVWTGKGHASRPVRRRRRRTLQAYTGWSSVLPPSATGGLDRGRHGVTE